MTRLTAGVAAAITAGGQSRRFGQDKALYEVGGVPLLQRVAGSLPDLAPRFLIAPAGKYTLPGWQSVPDLRPGEGPLAGLETALSACSEHPAGGGWLAFAAVDLPNLTPGYWALLQAHTAPGQQAVIGHDAHGRPQPLAALYHVSALPLVSALLDAGERRMNRLLQQLRRADVAWDRIGASTPEVYLNLNVPPEGGASEVPAASAPER